MAQVTCSRCGSTATGLAAAPLPGDYGRLVHEQTCAACWGEWLREQVKLINELRLSPADPAHYERLQTEMATWLNLRNEE